MLSLSPEDLVFVMCRRPQGWEPHAARECLVPDPARWRVPLHCRLLCNSPPPSSA